MNKDKFKKIARSAAIIFLIIGIVIGRPSVRGGEQNHDIAQNHTANIVSPIQATPLESHLSSDIEELLGLNDILFKIEQEIAQEAARPNPITEANLYRLRDFEYLRRQFFISDRNTRLLPKDIDVDAFINADLSICRGSNPGPRVLIFHTHSTEMFADSNPDNPMDGVLGVGARLAELLEEKGIETLHDTRRFDMVNGVPARAGSYERMEPYIRQVLRDNPTIEIVIDLHRDGIPETTPPLVTYIDGNRVARIMFVNGLSRRYDSDGELEAVPWLPNPFLRENLAFSFQLQLEANRMYPGFARRVYLKAFRYSLHLMPRTILLEVGAQNNTMEEAHNAMPYVASVIANVILR